MSKKILSLVIAMVLVLSMALGACKPKPEPEPPVEKKEKADAYDKVSKAMDAVNDADMLSVYMQTHLTIETGNEEVIVYMVGPAKVVKDGEDSQMYISQSISSGDQESQVEMYYRNGIVYTETDGTRTQEVMTFDELFAQQNLLIATIDKKYVKKTATERVKDGVAYTFIMDGSGLKEMALKNLGSDPTVAASLSDANLSFGDAEVDVVLDRKGNVISESMSMPFEFTISGAKTTINLRMTITDIETTDVTVYYPSYIDSTYKRSTVSNIAFAVPSNWSAMELNDEASIEMGRYYTDEYFMLIEEAASQNPNVALVDYGNVVRDQMVSNISNPIVGEWKDITLDTIGFPGRQIEFSGTVSDLDVTYLVTVFRTNDYYCQAISWSYTSDYPDVVGNFQDIIKSAKYE